MPPCCVFMWMLRVWTQVSMLSWCSSPLMHLPSVLVKVKEELASLPELQKETSAGSPPPSNLSVLVRLSVLLGFSSTAAHWTSLETWTRQWYSCSEPSINPVSGTSQSSDSHLCPQATPSACWMSTTKEEWWNQIVPHSISVHRERLVSTGQAC